MNKKAYLLLGFFSIFFLCLHIVKAQEASVKASLDTSSIKIGEQTKLNFFITAPSKAKLFLPTIKDSIYKIEVIEKLKLDSSFTTDKLYITYTQSYLITSFDSGYRAIPPYDFGIQMGNDTNKKVLTSEAMLLRVQGIVVDTTQAIKPIKPIAEIPYGFIDFIEEHKNYVLALLLILALITAVYFWLKNKKQTKETVVEQKPILPAHIKALNELAKIEQEKLWQGGFYKNYHSRISDVLRTYLEDRFHFNALELTTNEIIDYMKKYQPAEIQSNKLQDTLILADMVKFAKHQPLPFEHEQSLKNCYEFINMTAQNTVE
jgi:hypothetical protein